MLEDQAWTGAVQMLAVASTGSIVNIKAGKEKEKQL